MVINSNGHPAQRSNAMSTLFFLFCFSHRQSTVDVRIWQHSGKIGCGFLYMFGHEQNEKPDKQQNNQPPLLLQCRSGDILEAAVRMIHAISWLSRIIDHSIEMGKRDYSIKLNFCLLLNRWNHILFIFKDSTQPLKRFFIFRIRADGHHHQSRSYVRILVCVWRDTFEPAHWRYDDFYLALLQAEGRNRITVWFTVSTWLEGSSEYSALAQFG